jgi:pimeloyl-ACP methyl ester carboxylesterase
MVLGTSNTRYPNSARPINAYYRRGHGNRGVPSYGYSLTNQTKDLVSLLDYFRIKNPVIIAIAFGATIAINLALEYPGRVRGIIMEGWSEIEDNPEYIKHLDRHPLSLRS